MTKRTEVAERRHSVEARRQGERTSAGAADANLRRLVHELQVHQIELETQNVELIQTRADLDSALASYTELYDFAPVGYVTCDRHGIIQKVNLAGAGQLSAERTYLIGKRFVNFITVDSRVVFAALLERAYVSKAREACNIRLLSGAQSSERRFVRIKAVFSGESSNLNIIMIDISATKRAEIALQKQEEFMVSVLNAMPDRVCIVDRQSGILFANRPPAGVSIKRVLGADATAYVAPEHQDLLRNSISQVFETGTSRRFEVLEHGDQDDLIWCETVAAPICHDDQVISVTLLSRDISERKLNEDKLRQLSLAVEQTPLSVLITDRDGCIEYANAAFTTITGYATEEGLRQNPRLLKSGLTPSETYAALWQTLERGETWSGEFINRRKNGDLYVEYSIITPVRQADGRATHYIAIQEDITERKRVEEELDQHRNHLEVLVNQRSGQIEELNTQLERRVQESEAANRAKSTFLANMSHEIRTPMNVIIGLAHLLQRDVTDPMKRQRLDQLCEGANHVLAIINDILDLSKLEVKRLKLDHGDFKLDTVVTMVLRMVGGQAQEKGLALTTQISPSVPAMRLNGDSMRLAQVLINLCGNAIKFTDHGEVRLSIDCLAENADSISLRFTVEDSGIGIASADQARLFQPFMQAEGSAVRGGTGLGLNISQHLVELMGGTIVIDSRLGAGSRFSFEITLQHATASDAEPRAVIPATSFRGRRVLFAEDHPLSQEILLEMLEDLGCEVDAASTGVEAVECVRERSYDLILMDMRMPKMDGLEATRAIRKLPGRRDVPIIALTANAFADDRQNCLDAGMNAHLAKPVTPATLAAVLGRWLPDLTVSGADTLACDSELKRALAEIPGLDVGQSFRRSQEQLINYCVLLNRFLKMHGQDMARLREYLSSGQHNAAEVVVHSLKGIADLIGARRVALLANEIVHKLREPGDPASIVALASACETELESLAKAARSLPGLPEADATK